MRTQNFNTSRIIYPAYLKGKVGCQLRDLISNGNVMTARGVTSPADCRSFQTLIGKAVIVEARIEFALLHKLQSDEFNDSKCGKRCH